MNRALFGLSRQFTAVQRRGISKGVESTPPLRFFPMHERIGLYLFIAVAFLSYPTTVLLRLDTLRPRADNLLSPEVQAQIDAIREARRK